MPDQKHPISAPFRVTFTRNTYRESPESLDPYRPAAFLVWDTPTRSKHQHLKQLWIEWKTLHAPYSYRIPEQARTDQTGDTRTRRRITEAASHLPPVPPHTFTPWSHPLRECGPVWPKSHPRAVGNSPYAFQRNPHQAKKRPGRPRKPSTRPPGLPPKFSARFSFRIPALLVRPKCHRAKVHPSYHVPPLSLVCDPDHERGLTAHQVAFREWQIIAASVFHRYCLDTGHPAPIPKKLPRGTVTRYLGPAHRMDCPLEYEPRPPLFPNPYAEQLAAIAHHGGETLGGDDTPDTFTPAERDPLAGLDETEAERVKRETLAQLARDAMQHDRKAVFRAAVVGTQAAHQNEERQRLRAMGMPRDRRTAAYRQWIITHGIKELTNSNTDQ